ncbi:LysR family transcriptional regulator [Pseudomonas asiatica]|uniref:LysR family transcriptional regulator n=1 Tax=Pseudomonas asiatica TaxID=2219225 RepID=UPI0025AAB0A9|nr:LysR family transcriptional regulator [Pseudomonas asiatica]MDM9590455.1 LysR family transcriptional regulator [Pseudomonas asiatica]
MKESLYNIRLLRIFLTVADNQGFSAAQQDLNMSTSAISTYMNQLESQLGMQLCNRGRAGFSLTSKGQLVYEEAKKLIGQIDSFENYVAEIKGELRGTVTIGILDSMLTDSRFDIPELLGNFSQKSDKIHVNLKILSPFELQKEVLEGKIDLAIGSLPTKMSGLKYVPLYIEQHWLYCSNRHPLYALKSTSIEKVTEHALIKRGYWSNSEGMRHGFTQYSATIDTMEAELILILSGNYIGYLPDHLAKNWEDEGRLLRIMPDNFGYTAEFSLIIKNGRSRESLIQAFKEEIYHAFGLTEKLIKSRNSVDH